ncbi:MAG: type II toxin-antitoxin system PemK/MazF family toxin, partial [bacterium]
MPESGLTSDGRRIHIYVSKQQYEEIEGCVGSDGVTVAGFCREAFEHYLSDKRKEIRQQKLAETCRKLIDVEERKSYKYGDVVVVQLSQQATIKKNGVGAGLRAVVVSSDALNKNLETVIVCPLIEQAPILESVTGATFVPKEVVGLRND